MVPISPRTALCETAKSAPLWPAISAGPDGSPAIPHGSRVKVRLQHPGGWMLDRIPAWAKWATVAPGEMGAKFNGIYWDPPPRERHHWCVPCSWPAFPSCRGLLAHMIASKGRTCTRPEAAALSSEPLSSPAASESGDSDTACFSHVYAGSSATVSNPCRWLNVLLRCTSYEAA